MKRFVAIILTVMLTMTALGEGKSREKGTGQPIRVAPEAELPDESVTAAEYSAMLFRGERAWSTESMLNALLGENYQSVYPTEEWDHTSFHYLPPCIYGMYPRSVDIDEEHLYYSDTVVTGRWDGRYTKPSMNMTREESLVYCRALLSQVLPEDWLAHGSRANELWWRWNTNADRWKTEEEYIESTVPEREHDFFFEHWADNGLRIVGDEIVARVNANGLEEMQIRWNQFTASEETMRLMPLEEAIERASGIRRQALTLIYAVPVYSNWLTWSEEYHLSWYLTTNNGRCVVDCVTGEAKFDIY